MSDFEDDVLNSDGDLDYEVCEEDEEALLADDQSRAGKQQQVLDARERIQMRKMSKTEEEWDEEEEDEDNEGRGRFLSERTPNPQAVPSRPREDIPDSLEQVEVPEAEVANRRPQNNFYGRGRGGRRGGRFFGRGNFRGRGRFNGNDGMGRYHDNQQQPLLQTPVNAPTKILINPHFKGPRPLLSTPTHFPEQEDKFRPPPPHFGHPQMNSHPPPGPPGPKYQQFNQPLLPPPSQPYHDPPVPYVDQPPPYNPPPPQRLPPPEWGPQDPYYDNRPPPHPEYLPPHRPPPHRQPLLQGPPYGGPPPPREQYHEPPPHRPPPLQQSFPPPPPYQQQAAPPYSQPPPPQFQQLPPPVNYGPPPPVQPSYLQGPPPPLGSTAPYYDHLGGPPPNIYSAPPPTHQQHQPLPLMDRTSIFLSERLERRRRSRSRSPLYDRYSRRSRSRSRSYSPPRRYRDDIRRDRPPPRRLSPEPLRRPVRKLSPPPIRRREASPPPLKRNPEETAYMRAIEKQKQERETVLKMKAIKRKLEAEKKKRDGDKDSPEKVKEPQPYNAAPGPSTQQMVSPKKPLLSTPLLSTVILKPKLRVIKQEEPSRKISLISANEVDEPLISRTLSNNGRDQPVRRILTSKRELSAYSVEPSMSVSSVLRGAEGPSQNKQLSKKILKKGVVITKPADQAGLSMKIIDSASTLSSNIQMRLATSKAAAPGVTVAVDNISPSTTADSLKKLGLGLGLKKIIMKKAGSQQAAHLVFGSREGAEQFVANNQRKSLDLSVIDLKVI